MPPTGATTYVREGKPAPRNGLVPDPAQSTVIPFFSQAATFDRLWPLIHSYLDEMMDRGKYSHGNQVAAFEAELGAWTGARYVVGVNSGTDALVLLLRSCGLTPGAEVVVPAFSFIASASSVVLAGGRPVFADVDPGTYAIDAQAASAAVTSQTQVIMPVHLFSQMADMQALGELASARQLILVEDSAEAVGMRWHGTHAGVLGAGGVLSFFPSKILGAIGDAGAILTNDREIARTAGALRHHGRFGKTLDNFPLISNPTKLPGFNSKMDDIQAAVLRAKLSCLDKDIARRQELARAYSERLDMMPEVIRTPGTEHRGPSEMVFYVYLIEVERRDRLASYLAHRGIGTEVYYPTPLHLQPCFAYLGYRKGEFPCAETACARSLALPLYPDLSLGDVERVCDAIRDFFRGSRR